ncbi:MAG: hypothetical protein LLG01_14450 [Planctomycetaceae bacterium]|nr:hypothetical protein [Planctomycetaceae bacterium]
MPTDLLQFDIAAFVNEQCAKLGTSPEMFGLIDLKRKESVCKSFRFKLAPQERLLLAEEDFALTDKALYYLFDPVPLPCILTAEVESDEGTPTLKVNDSTIGWNKTTRYAGMLLELGRRIRRSLLTRTDDRWRKLMTDISDKNLIDSAAKATFDGLSAKRVRERLASDGADAWVASFMAEFMTSRRRGNNRLWSVLSIVGGLALLGVMILLISLSLTGSINMRGRGAIKFLGGGVIAGVVLTISGIVTLVKSKPAGSSRQYANEYTLMIEAIL